MFPFSVKSCLLLSIITFLSFIKTYCWHAYDPKKINKPNRCINQYNNTEVPIHINITNSYRLWPDLVRPQDLQNGKSLYGFHEAISIIHKHQHPKNCQDSKFIISSGWQWGFGSVVHTEGATFALAMELNRIYLPNPDGPLKGNKNDNSWQTRNSFCKSQNITNMDCYYEPWSSCTIHDALGVPADTPITLKYIINKYPVLNDDQFFMYNNKLHSKVPFEELNKLKIFIILHTARSRANSRFIPSILSPILQCSPIATGKEYYWWRAISASYYLRPNKNTLNYLSKLRSLQIQSNESCIGMHIRHGDKDSEMTLIPFKNYSNAAEILIKNNYINNIIQYKSNKIPIFFGTEDPLVVEEAQTYADTSKIFRIIYTNLFDRYYVSARLNNKDRNLFKETLHDENEYISMLLNLEYALKCDAWVCTLASNTCRLIDELRATIGGKANKPFVDLSIETCKEPPCIDSGFDISNVG
eukprot:gene10792-22529_t